ncbi:MAG: fused MFS/spermidine synthase [bacterium]|nr:fused MFS/spermidine synthase [bacterium]
MASKKKTVNSTGDNISSKNPVNGYSRVFLAYLLITAFVCGSLIMVIEVMGSRVIGPFYGVSLFVWTSLITVTLIALALGYAIGGSLSVQRNHPDWLYGVIAVSGLMCTFIPILRTPILQMFQPLGLRMGSLASSAFLFGPTLLLLGFVSPYLVRILAHEITNVGRTAGVLYSISTMGSFIGTVLTGFYLIAFFGVDRIFQATGGLLITLSVLYLILFRKKRWALLFFIPVFMVPMPEPFVRKQLSSGVIVSEVANVDSYYGNLKVVDYDLGGFKTREMVIDGLVQGGIDKQNGQSVYGYSYFLQYLPTVIRPDGKSCLVIGLGAGITPKYYERLGIKTDVVDIDPSVVRLAREYFNFSTNGKTHIQDARYFLNTTTSKWHYIILDVFNGDTTPAHLVSREALEVVKRAMKEGGILATNLIGSLDRKTYMTASVVKTFQSVFENVDVIPLFSPETGAAFGNMIIVAYDGRPWSPDWNMIRSFPAHPLARKQLMTPLISPPRIPVHPDAIILTDNYNPVDFYDSWIRESVRRNIQMDTDWDLLTGS